MPEPLNPDKISVAVIIGGHAYDVPAFKRLFDSFEDVVAYPQDISNFSRAWGVTPDAYDVLLFYNAGGDTAEDMDATWGAGTAAAVEAVGQAQQGVVMLHHAIRSYMAWPRWSALLGIPHEQREGSEFTVEFGQTMRVTVTDPRPSDRPRPRPLGRGQRGVADHGVDAEGRRVGPDDHRQRGDPDEVDGVVPSPGQRPGVLPDPRPRRRGVLAAELSNHAAPRHPLGGRPAVASGAELSPPSGAWRRSA